MREVAGAAGVSLGQVQHYFASRTAMLEFAMEFAAEQTSQRVTQRLERLGSPPHPRDALRVILIEMLPLHADARATSRMSAAYTPPHPRDALRVILIEMLPLHADARATSRMSAAYTLEALHDPELHERARLGLRNGRTLTERLIRQAIAEGHLPPDRDPVIETNLLLALTGFTPLLDLGVIDPDAASAAIDYYLDRLFDGPSHSPS